MKRLTPFLLGLALVSCDGEPRPEELVKGRDLCGTCRMPVSDVRFAAQITAPGELPRFFDDPGCFAEFIKTGSVKEPGAIAWAAVPLGLGWVTNAWWLGRRQERLAKAGPSAPLAGQVTGQGTAAVASP